MLTVAQFHYLILRHTLGVKRASHPKDSIESLAGAQFPTSRHEIVDSCTVSLPQRHENVDSCTVSLPHTEAHSKLNFRESGISLHGIRAVAQFHYFRHEIVDSCTVSLPQGMKSLTVAQFYYLILRHTLSSISASLEFLSMES